MEDAIVLNFIDQDSNDEAGVIIRPAGDVIAVCFTLKQDGDMELFLRPDEWRQVMAQLQRVLDLAESKTDR